MLPEEIKEYIDRLQDATVIAPFAQQREMPPAEDEEGRWYELSEAVARRRVVFMRYWVQSREELTARRVHPLGLVYYSDHWNLIAFDELRDGIRNFRLDQIVNMRVEEDGFEPPAGFDLKEHLRERGESPRNVRIRVDFAERAVRWARRTLPTDIEEVEELGEEGARFTFYFENLDYIARWLLRYGTDARVIEPDALKDRVRQRAEALAAHYSQVVA